MRMFPFDFMAPALEAAEIMVESQMVIGMRLAGMAGFWPMPQDENTRMVEEKMAAGTAAMQAMLKSGMAGGSLSDMAMAGLRPVRQKTKSNAKRLQRKVVAPLFG